MSVINLDIEETVRFDPRKLADLYRTMGEIGAENVLCDAMEDLTIQLVRVEKLAARARTREVCDLVDNIAQRADQIGLLGLACVARDVAYCGKTGDDRSFQATTARLARMGDKSLSTIWDPQGMMV